MYPRLKIIRTDEITIFMVPDPSRVAYWREYIDKNDTLPNPVSVSVLGKGEYLLLDESSYLQAVRDLHLEYIPVQVMTLQPDGMVEAALLIGEFVESRLKDFINQFPRALIIQPAEKKRPIAVDYVNATITFPDHHRLSLDFRRNQKKELTGHLFNFLNFLERNFPVHDKVLISDLKSTNLKVTSQETLIEIYNLHTSDLIGAARNRLLFPAGMIYISTEPRLLGIDYPLRVLKDRAPLREKNRFLLDLLNFRLRCGHPEYFRSGVCLLNRH